MLRFFFIKTKLCGILLEFFSPLRSSQNSSPIILCAKATVHSPSAIESECVDQISKVLCRFEFYNCSRKSKFEKMRLAIVFMCVFILHIHWVCGDSNTNLPQSTEKSVIVENNTEMQHSDDGKNIAIEPSVALDNLLKQTGFFFGPGTTIID